MSARTVAVALAVAAVLAAAAGGVATATAQQDSDANASIDYAGDRLTLPPDRYATVAGDTSFEPPTNVTIRARSSGDSPFIKSKKLMVQTDGSFAETLDFSGVETGTTGTLTVVGPNGTQLAETEFVVQESTPTPSPTATASPTVTDSPTPTDSATPTDTSQPGFGALAALAAALVAGLLAARS